LRGAGTISATKGRGKIHICLFSRADGIEKLALHGGNVSGSAEEDLRRASRCKLLVVLHDVFVDVVLFQGKSVEEAYYPVATAGINVSHLLHEKLFKHCDAVMPFLFEQTYAFEVSFSCLFCSLPPLLLLLCF
jgi:hypothetical protein